MNKLTDGMQYQPKKPRLTSQHVEAIRIIVDTAWQNETTLPALVILSRLADYMEGEHAKAKTFKTKVNKYYYMLKRGETIPKRTASNASVIDAAIEKYNQNK